MSDVLSKEVQKIVPKAMVDGTFSNRVKTMMELNEKAQFRLSAELNDDESAISNDPELILEAVKVTGKSTVDLLESARRYIDSLVKLQKISDDGQPVPGNKIEGFHELSPEEIHESTSNSKI